MQGTGPHHRPCGCISQARTKQGKYTPGNLADTHCSLELRTGLFSTLYSLSTSCCYREDPTREWKEELEKAKHDTKTGNTGMFNPRSQSAPLRTIPFFLTVNGKTKCKTKPKHRHLSPADLARWADLLSRAWPSRTDYVRQQKKYLRRKRGQEFPQEKGWYLQDGDISNSIQRAHEICLNEQILLSGKLKERKYDWSLRGHRSSLQLGLCLGTHLTKT